MKIIIFGTGEGGRNGFRHYKSQCDIVGFCDNDPAKQGKTLFDLPIYAPSDLVNIAIDQIVICSMYRNEILKQLVDGLKIPAGKIDVYGEKKPAATAGRVIKPDSDPMIRELIDFVLLHTRNGVGKFAFWGWNYEVMTALERSGVLSNIESLFVSEKPAQDILSCRVSQDYYGMENLFVEPDQLSAFKPEKICIILDDASKAIAVYEQLLETYHFSPMNIFTARIMWKQSFYESSNAFNKIVQSVPNYVTGGLVPKSLFNLYDGLRWVIQNNIPGRIINFGVSRGWSMYFIAKTLEYFGDHKRKIIGFDSFRGFPQSASPLDLCNLKYKAVCNGITPEKALANQEITEHNLVTFKDRMQIIDGDIGETIEQLGDEPVALALFDMDDYSPTRIALAPTYKLLSSKGVFVFDHYTYDSSAGFAIGQRIAMKEFLSRTPMFNFSESNFFIK